MEPLAARWGPKPQAHTGAPSPTPAPQSALDPVSTLFPLLEHRKGSLRPTLCGPHPRNPRGCLRTSSQMKPILGKARSTQDPYPVAESDPRIHSAAL